MSLSFLRQQANPPDEQDLVTGELRQQVTAAIKVLDVNRRPIIRWFFLALVGFNLVLWSVALPIAFLLR